MEIFIKLCKLKLSANIWAHKSYLNFSEIFDQPGVVLKCITTLLIQCQKRAKTTYELSLKTTDIDIETFMVIIVFRVFPNQNIQTNLWCNLLSIFFNLLWHRSFQLMILSNSEFRILMSPYLKISVKNKWREISYRNKIIK